MPRGCARRPSVAAGDVTDRCSCASRRLAPPPWRARRLRGCRRRRASERRAAPARARGSRRPPARSARGTIDPEPPRELARCLRGRPPRRLEPIRTSAQSNGAEVDGHDPLGRVSRRTDGDLGRRTAGVADGDARRQLDPRGRKSAGVGEPALLLGRQDADRLPCAVPERALVVETRPLR